jgi:hypothetical protein
VLARFGATVTFGAGPCLSQAYGPANNKAFSSPDEINASPAWASNRHLSIQFADDWAKRARERVAQSFVSTARASSPSSGM